MILKKPYAFLIKYFRAIHFLLLFLLVFYSFKSNGVFQFFDNYVRNNYQTSITTNLHSIYAPISLIIIVIFILVASILFLVLMIRKKKPYRLYLFLSLYYLFILIFLLYVRGVLASFSSSLLAATAARSLRDIIIIVSLPQYIFIFSVFIRAIGFDIKKFDFESDLKKMDYSAKDAEEFEVNVNLNVYKVEQKTRRLIRELIYYVKENKFVVIFLGIVAIIVLINFIHNNTYGNYDVTYRINKTFNYEKADVTFEDAFITNLDYSGKQINEKYFLVLKTKMSNESGSGVKIDYNNFRLNVGGNLITPTINDAKYFIDIASSNVPTLISHRHEYDFVLVYEVDAKDINKVKRVEIYNGSVYEKGEYIDKHIYVNINPKKIIKIEKVGDYSLNDSIPFEQSLLNKTTLLVKSKNIYKRYIYKYSDCISDDNCGYFDDLLTLKYDSANNIMMIFESEYVQDTSIGYSLNYTDISSFAKNFCSIQYRVDGKLYTDAYNITPDNATNFIAFEISQKVEYADLIQLIITIRNKRYYINFTP